MVLEAHYLVRKEFKKQRYESLYMDLAIRIAEMSYARRLRVGSVIVKESNIISFGWNGMPASWDNNCEFEECVDLPVGVILKTKPEVLHAEQNALAKLAKSTESGNGATMFTTHAPCIVCAKMIYQSGIIGVYYRNLYRDVLGIDFLKKCGVEVNKC